MDRLAESLEGLGGVLSFRDKWLSVHVACTICALALVRRHRLPLSKPR